MKFMIILFALYAPTLLAVKKDLIVSEAAYDTHYAPIPLSYHDRSYGRNSYGKHTQSYGDNGHSAYGNHDGYSDNGYNHNMLKKYADYASTGAYGGHHGQRGYNHGHGLYSRNRGYGYEKHYAYDKELATKSHSADHGAHGAHYGHHATHDKHGISSHGAYGHSRYGNHDKYGSHGYGKYGHLLGTYGSNAYGDYDAYQPQNTPITPYTGHHYSGHDYSPSHPIAVTYQPSTTYY